MISQAPLSVGVVGGSIAGCTVAIELIRAGCEVTLFERSGDALKDRGAGIGVPASVLDIFMARDLVAPDMPYFSGNSFSRIWRTEDKSKYGYLAWDQPAQLALMNWGVLYRNLRERVPDDCYGSRRHVQEIHGHKDGASLVLSDRSTHGFDLVVCADGYASLGRRTLFPDTDIEYAGYVLWRGFIPESELSESPPLADGIRCIGYPGGHGIFYFVPGPDGSVAVGERLVNWGMYVPVDDDALSEFLTDNTGQVHEGSLPPGGMPLNTEAALKRDASTRLPDYYADIIEKSPDTFAYAIYDCEVPAYRVGRICLAGDAGAFARPHSAAGALKGINDAVALGTALSGNSPLDERLTEWNIERTKVNNELVRFGNQLGRALVKEIPDWSVMDVSQMETWFGSIVTIDSTYISKSN